MSFINESGSWIDTNAIGLRFSASEKLVPGANYELVSTASQDDLPWIIGKDLVFRAPQDVSKCLRSNSTSPKNVFLKMATVKRARIATLGDIKSCKPNIVCIILELEEEFRDPNIVFDFVSKVTLDFGLVSASGETLNGKLDGLTSVNGWKTLDLRSPLMKLRQRPLLRAKIMK